MGHWLMKSEPAAFSWDDLVRMGREHWDGVRNHQASANMAAMKLGDRAFFYHSVTGKEIVGVMEVVKTYYPDPSDPKGKFGMVDVAPVMPVQTPVTLAQIKADPRFAEFALIRQSRLSVMQVSDEHWHLLCDMAGIAA